MAARQIWLFLTEADVAQVLEMIERRDPGTVASGGRYLQGDPRELLGDPAKLLRRESLPNERRIYLFHRKHSSDLLAHQQPKGPFAGWVQIDEERSDCLVLRLQTAAPGELPPARLYAHTSFWRAADKIRKKPAFALWANQTLRWLKGQLPSTSASFMRIGPDALRRAQSGELELSYLYRNIPAEPKAP